MEICVMEICVMEIRVTKIHFVVFMSWGFMS